MIIGIMEIRLPAISTLYSVLYWPFSVDGANIFQVYSRVALPLCAPTLATLAVTTFMESWND